MRLDQIDRLRPRAVLLLALLGAGLAMTGCEVAEPQLPTYQTTLTLPLGEERIDMIDAIDDEDYLVELPDGGLGFQIEGDPDTVSLDIDLGADIAPQSVSGDLGEFAVTVDAPADFDFPLGDLFPAANAMDGMTLPVPAFDFAVSSPPRDLAEIESALLATGTLTVSVDNGLPVPISADSGPDQLVLELLHPGSLQTLATIVFGSIAPGAQAQQTADLAGVQLPTSVEVRLVGGSPGSDGSPVTVDAGATVAVSAAFDDLTVSEAEAVVGPQEFTTEISTALPDDYAVQRAVIASGTLPLSVRNDLAIPCRAIISWPEVRDLDDQPLTLTIDLPAGGSENAEAVFAGRVIQAPAGSSLTELQAVVVATSPGSDGQPVLIEADAGLVAELGAGRIEFSSVTGTVPRYDYDFEPMQEEIDLPDELEGLLLQRASLELELVNSAGVAAEAQFHLVGINEAGVQRALDVVEPIEAATADRAATTTIVLDESNSGIVEFLNNLPTSITLEGGVAVGGDGQQGTVRPDDRAVVNWRITAPVEVVVESSRIYGDPEDLGLEEDTRDMIADHAGAAAITLDVLNHLPVGVETRMLFSPDTLTIKTDPVLVVGPISVSAGAVDPQSGEVSEPSTSRPQIALTAAQTQVLATEGLYSLLEVSLPSTDGNAVRVLSTDYVRVQGVISLDVEVHDDEDED
jgi:hypothetical protein